MNNPEKKEKEILLKWANLYFPPNYSLTTFQLLISDKENIITLFELLSNEEVSKKDYLPKLLKAVVKHTNPANFFDLSKLHIEDEREWMNFLIFLILKYEACVIDPEDEETHNTNFEDIYQVGKRKLLLWAKKTCRGICRIVNFEKSFLDGFAFCSIIHKFHEDWIENIDELDEEGLIQEKLEECFRKLGLEMFIVDFVDFEKAHSGIILMIVSVLRNRLMGLKKEKKVEEVKKEEVEEVKEEEKDQILIGKTVLFEKKLLFKKGENLKEEEVGEEKTVEITDEKDNDSLKMVKIEDLEEPVNPFFENLESEEEKKVEFSEEELFRRFSKEVSIGNVNDDKFQNTDISFFPEEDEKKKDNEETEEILFKKEGVVNQLEDSEDDSEEIPQSPSPSTVLENGKMMEEDEKILLEKFAVSVEREELTKEEEMEEMEFNVEEKKEVVDLQLQDDKTISKEGETKVEVEEKLENKIDDDDDDEIVIDYVNMNEISYRFKEKGKKSEKSNEENEKPVVKQVELSKDDEDDEEIEIQYVEEAEKTDLNQEVEVRKNEIPQKELPKRKLPEKELPKKSLPAKKLPQKKEEKIAPPTLPPPPKKKKENIGSTISKSLKSMFGFTAKKKDVKKELEEAQRKHGKIDSDIMDFFEDIPKQVDRKKLQFLMESGIKKKDAIRYLIKCKNNVEQAMEEFFKDGGSKSDSLKDDLLRYDGGKDLKGDTHKDIKQTLLTPPSLFTLPPSNSSVISSFHILTEESGKDRKYGKESASNVLEERRSILDKQLFTPKRFESVLEKSAPKIVSQTNFFSNTPSQSNIANQPQPQPNTSVMNNSVVAPNENVVKFLMDAGVNREQAINALRETKNDVAKAMDVLFNKKKKEVKVPPKKNPNPRAYGNVNNNQKRNSNLMTQSMYVPRNDRNQYIMPKGYQNQNVNPRGNMTQTTYMPPVSQNNLTVQNNQYTRQSPQYHNPNTYQPTTIKSTQQVVKRTSSLLIKLDTPFVIICPYGGYLSVNSNVIKEGCRLCISQYAQQWTLNRYGHLEIATNKDLCVGVRSPKHEEFFSLQKKNLTNKNQKFIARAKTNDTISLMLYSNQGLCLDFQNSVAVAKMYYHSPDVSQSWRIKYA